MHSQDYDKQLLTLLCLSLCLSVHPSVCTSVSLYIRPSVCDSHWTDFHEICFRTSQNSVGKIQSLLEFDNMSGTVQDNLLYKTTYCTRQSTVQDNLLYKTTYCTRQPKYIYDYISLNSS
jgi:hypothetical protein